MKTRQLACAAVLATLALSAPSWAVTAEEHASHHPDQAASASATSSSGKAKVTNPASSKTSAAKKSAAPAPAASAEGGMCMPMGMSSQMSQAMDKQMQAMRDMHDKMMAAKTPEEKRALLADQMKTMQDGMAMMDRMGPAKSTGAGTGGMGDMAKTAPAAPTASAAGGMNGMNGMNGMSGMGSGMGCMGAMHEMMGKRIEMMESMMRMMMDRLSVEPAK